MGFKNILLAMNVQSPTANAAPACAPPGCCSASAPPPAERTAPSLPPSPPPRAAPSKKIITVTPQHQSGIPELFLGLLNESELVDVELLGMAGVNNQTLKSTNQTRGGRARR